MLCLSCLCELSAAATDDQLYPEAASKASVLASYEAIYIGEYKGFSLSLLRSLTRLSNGDYRLENRLDNSLMGFTEESTFSLTDQHQGSIDQQKIVSKYYRYQGSGFNRRVRQLDFLPAEGQVNSLHKGKRYQLPYAENLLDRLNQFENLRLMLLNQETIHNTKQAAILAPLSFKVADGKRIKDYQLSYCGETITETGLGEINSLCYKIIRNEKQTTIWLAPEWQYLIVKLLLNDDGEVNEIRLQRASVNGRELVLP